MTVITTAFKANTWQMASYYRILKMESSHECFNKTTPPEKNNKKKTKLKARRETFFYVMRTLVRVSKGDHLPEWKT